MTDLYELEERAYKALGDLADEYREEGHDIRADNVESLQSLLWTLIKGESI